MRLALSVRAQPLHRIRAITLDLDDTLWAIAPVIERAERELWSWLAEHYPRVRDCWDADGLAGLRERTFLEHRARAHDLRFLRRAMLAEIAAVAGYGDELVDPAFAVFDRARNAVDLYPDVVPALERLRDDFALVAVTNGNACLATIGIRHLFDDVVTAAEAGVAKPAPAIFDAACLRAGAQPDEVVHVGDHPEFDIAGAKQAGLRAAWINRRGDPWPQHLSRPDAEISALGELAALLTPLAHAR
ncbi:MAG TPA: HAD family hydrolase [Woeseiaceae bacterium]|nr:HAD family hydrolase [Woeseiaceae bacterium]